MDSIKNRLRSSKKSLVNKKIKDECGSDCHGIDIISNLPNEILCHILSLMPTKDAIATCILSTKWRNLFALIPNHRLELDDTSSSHGELATDTHLLSFKNFMNSLFSVTLRNVHFIDSLSLICKRFGDGQTIAHWIDAALSLNTRRMDLQLHNLKNSNFLFDSLYGCNLVSLKLLLGFSGDAFEYRFSLPNLRMLFVKSFKLDVLNAIIESCSMLDTLIVGYCSGGMLRIRIPSLRILFIYNNSSRGGELELDTPKLQFLKYGGYLARSYLIHKMKSILKVHLDLSPYHANDVHEYDKRAGDLVKACCDVKNLWLSHDMVKMLYVYNCRGQLRFPKLVSLEIQDMATFGWHLLPTFLLNWAPNLTRVVMHKGFCMREYERFNACMQKCFSSCISRVSGACFHLKIIQRK